MERAENIGGWAKEGIVKPRSADIRTTKSTGSSGLRAIGELSGNLTVPPEQRSEYMLAMPFTPISSISEIIEGPDLRSTPNEFTSKKNGPRGPNAWGRLYRRRAARRVALKPWLAPVLQSGISPTTLMEKNRKFKSRKIKDLWDVFCEFRVDFQRPDESNSETKGLCLSWGLKHKGGRAPRVLQRFFEKYPEIAVWAIWVERAIHETPLRSGKNQSPRMDVLRECLAILLDAQLRRPGLPKNS